MIGLSVDQECADSLGVEESPESKRLVKIVPVSYTHLTLPTSDLV